MTDYDVDTSDTGKAARVVWAASVLFARVSGMNAENEVRKIQGQAMAYNSGYYFEAVECAFRMAKGEPP